MNNQGTVGYVVTDSWIKNVNFRRICLLSDVTADPTKCTIQKIETSQFEISPDSGVNYLEAGKVVSGADLSSRDIEVSSISLRTVVTVKVEAAQDEANRRLAEAAHPENTVAITPAVYLVILMGPRPDTFTFHSSFTRGKKASDVKDFSMNEDKLTFRDEDAASRFAKALTYAVALCSQAPPMIQLVLPS